VIILSARLTTSEMNVFRKVEKHFSQFSVGGEFNRMRINLILTSLFSEARAIFTANFPLLIEFHSVEKCNEVRMKYKNSINLIQPSSFF
jgi:hypothetical protein